MPQPSLQRDWHRADVKAELEKAGWNLSRLAVLHGLAPGTLRNVFRVPYPKAERIIADAIGLSPSVIWPSRYPTSSAPRAQTRKAA